jgi:hypothetical protein
MHESRPFVDEGIEFPRPSRSNDIPYVYILSASHSGSTLLTMLLAAHPDVASIGETSAAFKEATGDSALCSCALLQRDCPFWRRLRERLGRSGRFSGNERLSLEFRFREGSPMDRLLRAEIRGPVFEFIRDVAVSRHPAWRRRRRRLEDANVLAAEEALAWSGGRVFVDSSKEALRLKFMMCIPRFRVRVIHLIRDGRGVTASYLRKKPGDITRAVMEWRRSLISQQHILRRFSAEQTTRVRYEDLCSDVDRTVRRLYAFIGVDPTVKMRRHFEHHILGNRMRLRGIDEIRHDERWRTKLSNTDLAVFERLAGTVNRHYGYP